VEYIASGIYRSIIIALPKSRILRVVLIIKDKVNNRDKGQDVKNINMSYTKTRV